MYIAGAFVLGGVLALLATWANNSEKSKYSPDDSWHLTLHIRQDLKLIAFLMMGILLMLGVIADRI